MVTNHLYIDSLQFALCLSLYSSPSAAIIDDFPPGFHSAHSGLRLFQPRGTFRLSRRLATKGASSVVLVGAPCASLNQIGEQRYENDQALDRYTTKLSADDSRHLVQFSSIRCLSLTRTKRSLAVVKTFAAAGTTWRGCSREAGMENWRDVASAACEVVVL